MRWLLWWGLCVPVVASAAVPATVSADMADMIADAGSVAGLVLSVWLGIWAFRKMRATLAGELSGWKAYGGHGYSRREQAEDIRTLRKAGWSNAEIRRGSKGLDAWD